VLLLAELETLQKSFFEDLDYALRHD
jgi:hypothetical protein